MDTRTKPKLPKCPICKTQVELRNTNPFFPFCASRCQMIDLGNWIDEAYHLPISTDGTERSLPPENDEHLN